MEQQENNSGVYFTSLKLENVRCFGKEAVLDLSNSVGKSCKWNIILGNNGTGKTSLLQLISTFQLKRQKVNSGDYILFPSDIPNLSENRFFFNEYSTQFKASCTFFIPSLDSFREFEVEHNRHIQPINEHYESGPSYTSTGHYEVFLPINYVLGYGANRFMSFGKLTDQKSDPSETLFNEDARLINADEWLLGMDYAASRQSDLRSFAEHRRGLITEVLIQMLPDVTDIRFSMPTREALVPHVEFKTSFGWTGIHQLSLGYKTMVAWIVDVAARMFERYPDSDDPLAEPVVILVDEIDLHLHPKWQRRIFDFLTKKFPRAQFIVTAHSPLVVQSAPKDANIILLRQEVDEQGNAYVKIDNDVESVRNWRLDQIMTSDLFGLESTRSPEMERLLDERKILLQKDNLTSEEKARLKELNETADSLPTAEDPTDRKAMEIIREAAEVLRSKAEVHD